MASFFAIFVYRLYKIKKRRSNVPVDLYVLNTRVGAQAFAFSTVFATAAYMIYTGQFDEKRQLR